MYAFTCRELTFCMLRRDTLLAAANFALLLKFLKVCSFVLHGGSLSSFCDSIYFSEKAFRKLTFVCLWNLFVSFAFLRISTCSSSGKWMTSTHCGVQHPSCFSAHSSH